MNNKDGFKGKVFFCKNIEFNYNCTATESSSRPGTPGLPEDEYVILGSCDVDVKFTTDTRQQEIEIIEAAIKQREIDHSVWLDTMSGKIQSLRSIEHNPELEIVE